MKTTIDLPDIIFRKAKSTAAIRGISLKTFITEAVEKGLQETDESRKKFLSFLDTFSEVELETVQAIRESVAWSDEEDLQLTKEKWARDDQEKLGKSSKLNSLLFLTRTHFPP